MQNTPTWFKVLNHFYENGYFHNGLTIPFLLGTSLVLDTENVNLSVEDFVLQAADGSLPKKISVQRCPAIGEYVFGIIDNETINYPFGKAIAKEYENICITDNSFSEIPDIAGLKNLLSDRYQKMLDGALFSKNLGKWGDYTEKDLLRIKETAV